MVLSADLKSILINEGSIDAKSSGTDVAGAIRDVKGRINAGTIRPRTNHGVRLGMSEDEVKKILGKPTRALFSDRFHARELIYRRETPKDKDGNSWSSTNYYMFRGGKLYYIELSRDSEGEG